MTPRRPQHVFGLAVGRLVGQAPLVDSHSEAGEVGRFVSSCETLLRPLWAAGVPRSGMGCQAGLSTPSVWKCCALCRIPPV